MYKLLTILTLAIALFIPTDTSAQMSCSPVTSDNYSSCCGTAAGNTNSVDCKAYQRGYSTPVTPTNTTTTAPAPVGNMCEQIYSFNYNSCCGNFRSQNMEKCAVYDDGYYAPGTVGSGGTPSIRVVNTAVSSDSAIGSAPQAGSAELASCSAIRFLSLLDILIWVKCIIVVAIIPMIFALALVFFLWGVTKFIGASDSIKKEEGKKFIIAGLIGLFVMTSLWGIIRILGTTLGVDSSVVPMLQTTYLKQK